MKILIATLSLLMLCCISFAQTAKPFVIMGDLGQVTNEKISKVYLTYEMNGNRVFDSCVVKSEKFTFSGKIIMDRYAVLQYGRSLNTPSESDSKKFDLTHRKEFLLAPGTIKAISKVNFVNMSLTGVKATEDWEKVATATEPYTLARSKIWIDIFDSRKKYPSLTKPREQFTKEDSLQLAEYKSHNYELKAFEVFDSLDNEENNQYKQFIKQNPGSPINPILLFELTWACGFESDEMQKLYQLLPDSLKATDQVKEVKRLIELCMDTRIGQIGPNFSQPDTTGVIHQLTDYRGKYVIVDFWASSCGPCRIEMPHTLKLLEKYKNDGLVVLTVSWDDKRENWLKAISKDHMVGPVHLSDLKRDDNQAIKNYHVVHLPTSYLLDPTGKIIGKNLMGKKLTQKLEEIFGK